MRAVPEVAGRKPARMCMVVLFPRRWLEQADDLARADREREVLDRRDPAETAGEAGNINDRGTFHPETETLGRREDPLPRENAVG